ncbi:methylated-DNA--[protein]-cysteine S-methyltransferase [Methanobacterium alcaliphilum]|uniref:methylated-DNA--[protein]-cysteine S-methyltransferase n=1 Tax=Methanobacterium alcaliphilum TaxID=392018 RepID=UPI00200A1429|nr:MGMT family protein [Methanobacterium alcaliphilum]MCK9150600.1 MGMT family protein [Methanobacterium alcaliphilum]
MSDIYLKIIKKTSFGPVSILWVGFNGNFKIVKIILSNPEISAEDQVFNMFHDVEEVSCSGIDMISKDIQFFLNGAKIEFSLDVLEFNSCSFFQKQVLKAEYKIPRGNVTSYQFLAKYLGKEKGARAVGNALANNPFPIIIPCHRAIRSDRTLGGFQGGLKMKRILLENEGIKFDDNGKIIVQSFYYE